MLVDRDPTAKGDRGLWVKLWRDMVWSTLRGKPATREPFEARAEGRAADDVDKVWKQLQQPLAESVDLRSTYFLGAQASTAENVPFKDRARYQFLLHFWPYAAQVYVPEVVDVQKNRREFVGFALAIPDVSVLDGFCDDLWELLPRRDKRAAGFRPRGAVVDVAIEGALDIAARLRERVQTLEGARATGDLVLGIEVFHIARDGNNIPVLSTSRVEPRAEMIDEYRRVREQLRDPLFRRTRLLNLVAGRPWYAGFDRLLATVPHDTQGIGSPGFRHDARRSFEAAGQAREEQVTMNGEQEGSATESVEEMVYQLVGRYVSRRTEGKTGLSWEEVKSRGDAAKNEYNEARAKVAKDAFLAVRSRTGADFIDYFAGTLCSVPHHLRSAQFVTLTRALRAETDKVRTLTLLALSAHG
jgi:CRISPR-associated protein Cmx8